MFNQRTWRRIGLVSLAVCGVMAWGGTQPGVTRLGPVYQLVYWGMFLLALLLALYMALIDLRYTRMQYTLGEKELFEDTLGNEELRTALRSRPSRPSEQDQDQQPD